METEKKFVSALMIAISNCSLYSKGHHAFDELAKETFSILKEILGERFEIMLIEDELIVNKRPLMDAGINKNSLIKRFKRKEISRIDFIKGVSLPEIREFIADFSESGKGFKTYPHIKIGSVDVHIADVTEDALDKDSISCPYSREIEKVKDIFCSVSPFKPLNIAGLEEIVVHFIATFRKEANILKILSPVKSFSEYTYTHNANVALLAMFQAHSLGIRDELLHELGVAALLHDVGKLFISKEILDKKGKLDDREFAEMKNHPLYGAIYLTRMDNLTRLAPIIAYEHHMKFDCSGYPRLQLNGRRQHILSQIVAISDFFDALRSRRPYRESLDAKDIIALMKKSVATDFNPSLVDNFNRLLQIALTQ